MSESTTIQWDKGQDGIVVLTIDDPSQGANTMNAAYIASMAATVDRLEAEKDDITGVIITSGKKTFFAGGDLNDLLAVTKEQSAEFAEGIRIVKGQLRRLETLGKPVVAAINGAALGAGFGIAASCAFSSPAKTPFSACRRSRSACSAARATPCACSAIPPSTACCSPVISSRRRKWFGAARSRRRCLMTK